MLQGMSTPSLKPLRKPSAPAMELKERGDETDLPDIGDAFPPPPPPPPERAGHGRERGDETDLGDGRSRSTPLLAASWPASARAKNLSASRAAHAATRCSAPRRPATSAARRFATAAAARISCRCRRWRRRSRATARRRAGGVATGTRARTSRTRCDA